MVSGGSTSRTRKVFAIERRSVPASGWRKRCSTESSATWHAGFTSASSRIRQSGSLSSRKYGASESRLHLGRARGNGWFGILDKYLIPAFPGTLRAITAANAEAYLRQRRTPEKCP